MKSIINYSVVLFLFYSFIACNQRTNNELTPPSTQARLVSPTTVPKESFKVKAKFIDFEMGDITHYLFEDEQGEIWDFTTCSDEEFIFEQTLSKEQYTSFNKGWTSNSILQGRWFLLDCGTRLQPLYPDGPEDIAQIINDATLLY
ncbi:MAG: hypothetical protein ACRBFS_09685 [Aureispira sp.]